ncbi:TPA: hypothetical protein N0F65_010508 [Lagenidium giganteum]|uniref:Transmembrane protein 198 n=1 Tax=Lagenidium giganteum TaxID=4803 RepID=A0AAV2Z5M7_9STRA|nr:TPA: hypothetical protein N0F65_010508 [Lagenidium giganteum]
MPFHLTVRPTALLALVTWTMLVMFAQAADEDKAAIPAVRNATLSIFDSSDGIKAAPAAAAAIAIAAGLIVCFFGYRLLRPTMFLCGFLLGGVIVTSVIEYLFKSKSWFHMAMWIGFVVGGLIVGTMIVVMYNMGIFLVGAAAGVFLGYSLNTSIAHKIMPSQPSLSLLIFALVLGLLGGILAVKLEKPVVIVATSFVGAELAVWGIGYFGKNYPDATSLDTFRKRDDSGNYTYDIPGAWWAYLGGIIALFVLGMFMQFKKTGRDSSSSISDYRSKA